MQYITPYLPFVTFLLTITINIILAFKGANWFAYLVVNVAVILLFTSLGISPFDFITSVVNQLVDIIKAIVKAVIDGAGDLIGDLFDRIWPFTKI